MPPTTPIPLTRRDSGRTHGQAFTLIELLVVISIIAILVGILMPVAAAVRGRGDDVKCVSNLRQIGLGIIGYTNDHDQTLPGPLWSGQSPWYNTGDTGSLAAKLDTYLDLTPKQEWMQRASVFVCPAYEKAVTIRDAPVYIMGNIGSLQPWGYADPVKDPLKLAAVAEATDSSGRPISLAQTVAIRDTDQNDYTAPLPGWYDKLPDGTVHKTHQNALFFDWHVAQVDKKTHQPK